MDFENMPIDEQFFAGFDKQSIKVPPPWHLAIAALAAIDAELGLPDDGCNSTGRTLAAVRELQTRASSAQQQAQSLARAVMADQTAHDTWTRNALRYQLLLDGPHNFGVFVCGGDGSPDDSISNAELTAALDVLLGA
jgi:hypothetical protein